jgi:hypothetical protein
VSNHTAKNPSIKLVLGHLSFEPFLSRHAAFASSYLNFIKQFVVDPKECRSTMYLSRCQVAPWTSMIWNNYSFAI